MTSHDEFTFADAIKDPDDEKKVTLDLFKYCANYWRANEQYDLNEYVRPRKATGFAYSSGGGTSGLREPNWPTSLGATVTSGSVVFTCVQAGANGVNPISGPSGDSDPDGLTITDVSVSESTKILATYEGGSLGQDFDAVFTFTLNGAARVARQRVKVRAR